MAVLAEPAVFFALLEPSALDTVAGAVMRERVACLPVADQFPGFRILDGGARQPEHFVRFRLRELRTPDLAAYLLRLVLREALQQGRRRRGEIFAHHLLRDLARGRLIGISCTARGNQRRRSAKQSRSQPCLSHAFLAFSALESGHLDYGSVALIVEIRRQRN